MTFILMLAASIAIGWFAQTRKGRTGAGWAFLSMAAMATAWVFLFFCMSMAKPGIFDTDANLYGLAIMDVGGVGVLLGLVVASLPEKVKKEEK